MNNKYKLLIAIISLFFGIVIYSITGNSIFVTSIINIQVAELLPSYFSFYLPDCLWAFAYTMTLAIILDKPLHIFLIVIVCGLSIEIMQFLHLITGTGDIIDILVEIIGYLIAFSIIKEKK